MEASKSNSINSPPSLISKEKFLDSFQKNKDHFSCLSSYKSLLKLLESDLTENSKLVINEFLKEIQISMHSVQIVSLQKANFQQYTQAISHIYAYIYLKTVFLKEKLNSNCQFSFTMHLIFFLQVYRKSREKKNRFFSEKSIQENFLDSLYILSKNYLELSQTGGMQSFLKINTNLIASKHENNAFFESISTKINDHSHESFLVLENLSVILLSKLLKTLRYNNDFLNNEKEKTEIFINNYLTISLRVCSILIDATLKTQEVSINLIQSLINNVLKIIVHTLNVKHLDKILFEKLKDYGFIEIKFLIKVVFVILFDDVHFDEFEISKTEFESFQPSRQQIKTLIKVVHLNSEKEKIKVFQRTLKV